LVTERTQQALCELPMRGIILIPPGINSSPQVSGKLHAAILAVQFAWDGGDDSLTAPDAAWTR
jgi:hypothetical protein